MSIQVSITYSNAVPSSRPTYNIDTISQIVKSSAYYINSFVQGWGTLDYTITFDPTIATSTGGSNTSSQVGVLTSGGRLYDQGAGAEWKTGVDANGATTDGTLTIGGAVANYFFDTTLKTASDIPANSRDFFSTAVHETLHMIAFNGFADSNPDKSVYGQYIVQQNGNFFFTGSNAVAAYGGPVPLDSISPHAHLGNSTSPSSNSDALKGGFIDTLTTNGVRDYFTAVELAVLKDLGFVVSSTQATVTADTGSVTATITGAYANYIVDKVLDQVWLIDKTKVSYAQLVTPSVQNLKFSDATVRVSDLVVLPSTQSLLDTAYRNILRADPASSITTQAALAAQVDNGSLSLTAAFSQYIAKAGASTSVAVLSYQFFTGAIPSMSGIDYLVSNTGPNPNNLNSPYYTNFNLENRYINFAVNLGKIGEGQARFAANYGALTLSEATSKAYTTIFGIVPTEAKVAALLGGGRDAYFEAYGKDGLNGLGTKAAAVGWLLAEAVKADIGLFAKSNDAFLLDLADGANFSVDLIGVYGKPEFNLLG